MNMKMDSIRTFTVALAFAASAASLVSMSALAESGTPGAAGTTSVVALNSIELAAARAPNALPYKTVPYADLNLSHPAGIKTLQGRIEAAVNSVCPSADSRLLRQAQDMRDCRTASYGRAMHQVDLLTGQLRVAAR
ncbi:MAG: UrcA family protein [Gammaproteobacteria bacterium]|nr:UrcA family protein [Gammaproteobacteria bacterium]